jgi:hypothetical protein
LSSGGISFFVFLTHGIRAVSCCGTALGLAVDAGEHPIAVLHAFRPAHVFLLGFLLFLCGNLCCCRLENERNDMGAMLKTGLGINGGSMITNGALV